MQSHVHIVSDDLPETKTLKKLHIVHCIARLNNGGPARVIANLAREMERYGHRTTIIAGRCADDEMDLADELRAEGLRIEIIHHLGRGIAPIKDMQAFVEIYRRLKQLHPDVVHTHTAKAGAFGRLACRLLTLPCIHTYHGHVLRGYFSPSISWILKVLERFCAWRHHHHALTPSQYHELHVQYRIGEKDQWYVLPIPVSPLIAQSAEWHKNIIPSVPVIGFLGRCAAIKDLDLWVDVMVELAKSRPIQGLICGDGSERARIEERVKKSGVPVFFSGFVPAGQALAVMDVLLVTSHNEGLPLSIIEASGISGCDAVPVVASPVGGMSDVIKAGVVYGAARDASSLAAACIKMLEDVSLRKKLTDGARTYAMTITPSEMSPAYERLYYQVASAGCSS